MDASVPEPGKPRFRHSISSKVQRADRELSDDNKAKPPTHSAESEDCLVQRLKKGRKQAAKKAKEYQPKAAPAEENNTNLAQESEEPERMKSTSKKRAWLPDARDNDEYDDIHNGFVQASRKRPKTAQRNRPESEGKTAMVKKIKASGQAPEKPAENSGHVTPFTDEPSSKKRSRKPGHEDAQGQPVIEKSRKRMKASLAEDKPTTATRRKNDIGASSTNVDQGGGTARKA